MMTRTCLRWLITLVLLASAGVSAQSFSITKSAIGGAGGQALSADNGVRGTLGQPFSGITRNNSYGIFSGFWSFRYHLVAIGDGAFLVPERFELGQNYPNPFNPSTNIRFALPEAVAVRLEIYDMMGRKVAVLTPGAPGGAKLQPGWHQVSWDGRNLAGIPVASGMYIYRLVAGNFRQTRKMLLVK